MQYNEIYNICQPVMDWLKEQYPNNHKIVIDTTGAELIECGKLIALDKSLKETMFKQNVILPKEKKEEIQNILDMDTSKIQDDVHRFNIELWQKLIRYENQSEPKKKDNEVSPHE